MFLLDEKFTKIAKKLVHRFHVVHNEELADASSERGTPRADLWVGGDDNYFMTPNTVNEGLVTLEIILTAFDILRRLEFRGSMVQLRYLEEPEWLPKLGMALRGEGE